MCNFQNFGGHLTQIMDDVNLQAVLPARELSRLRPGNQQTPSIGLGGNLPTIIPVQALADTPCGLYDCVGFLYDDAMWPRESPLVLFITLIPSELTLFNCITLSYSQRYCQ